MVLKGQRVAESSQEKSLLKKKDEINEYKKKEIQKKKVTNRVPIFRIKRNITISLCTNLFEKNK